MMQGVPMKVKRPRCGTNTRCDAALAMAECGGNTAEAVKVFQLKHPHEVARPREFCERWYNNLRAHGNFKDTPRAGRPCKLTMQEARTCADIVAKGHYAKNKAGKWVFTHTATIKEACNLSPAFREIMERKPMSEPALLRNLRRARPHLQYVFLRQAKPMKDWLKLQHIDHCEVLLRRPDSVFDDMVFADAASMQISPPRYVSHRSR